MEHDFWASRWSAGRIGFHRAEPNEDLIAHAEQAWPTRRRVLVPLCGKSVDLLWLAERFDEVVGVEFVREAADAFFAALGVTPSMTERDGAVALSHANITLVVQDVFDVTSAMIGPVDAVWDRAALVALPPARHPRYADQLVALTPAGARILLVTFDYPQALMGGPPFSVGDDEVLALFSPATTAERLVRRLVNDAPPALPPDVSVHSSTWLLTRT